MTKYSNRWTDGEKTVKAETCPGEYWYPIYAPRRIHGAKYQPYTLRDGSAAWVHAANESMASAAQTNFQTRRGR